MTTVRTVGLSLATLFATIAMFAFVSVASAQDPAPMESATADSNLVAAAETESRQEFRQLDEDVQDLKKEVLDLNRDLFLLEEELLFPANSQVAFSSPSMSVSTSISIR